MLKLTSRIYKQNAQQSYMLDNKFDTVNMYPISNIASDPTTLYSEEITSISLNGTTHQLPLDSNVAPKYVRNVNNKQGDASFAKSRIECVIASGKTRYYSDVAIIGTPIVDLSLVGKSYVLDHKAKSYGDYPYIDTLNNYGWSLANWIDVNKSSTSDSLILDYSGTQFALNPWVRNIVPFDQVTKPTQADIWTDWYSAGGQYKPTTQTWTDNANFNMDSYSVFEMCSPNVVAVSDAGNDLVRMRNVYFPIVKTITRIDDHTFDIEWSAPVRIAYAAASQKKTLTVETDIDSYAFMDVVSSINIQVTGISLSTDTQDISVSLDKNGNLVPSVSKKNVIDIDADEVFTVGTYYVDYYINENGETVYFDTPWSEVISRRLLEKYKDGKFKFKCNVSAKWALENNVHVSAQVQLQLPDGKMFTRKGSVCTFEVKNIEKAYKNGEFTFTLDLLEV